MAKNVNRLLFETDIPKKIDNFLEGRMAYVFELDDEYAESDIPTTLMRSKADCPDLQDNLSQSQNDVVLHKLTQILSYIRTGNKKKNKKPKMDFDLERMSDDEAIDGQEIKTEPVDDGFKCFSDEEEDDKIEDKKSKKSKKDKRRRSRSRSRDRKDRKRSSRERSKERSKSDKRSGDKRRKKEEPKIRDEDIKTEKPKYFDDIEQDEKIQSGVNLHDIQKMAQKFDKKKEVVDKTGKDGMSFGDVPDSYAECYPSMQYEIAGVTNDSDDEADVTKMDLGKSGKGPMNRFDFENEEDYGDYMAKREALPKAAFQYGQKNSDRGNITKGKNRKDRRAEVHGNKEKQKLDHQMQKIKQIMDKREKTKKGGGDTYKAKY